MRESKKKKKKKKERRLISHGGFVRNLRTMLRTPLPSDQVKQSYQHLFDSNKQISSELVCGNSFVKILCTYFSFIYLVLWPPTLPPGNITVFWKVLIRLSSHFVRTHSLPTIASAKNFKEIERDFLVPAGKRLNWAILSPWHQEWCHSTWFYKLSEKVTFVDFEQGHQGF